MFRTTTQLVQIDVAAEDKDGKPVAGLTKDDFELFVRHKPQEIDTFTTTSIAPAPPAPLPPGTFSNKQAATEVTPGPLHRVPARLAKYKLAVAVVGASGTGEDAFGAARRSESRVIPKQQWPPDRAGVYFQSRTPQGTGRTSLRRTAAAANESRTGRISCARHRCGFSGRGKTSRRYLRTEGVDLGQHRLSG